MSARLSTGTHPVRDPFRQRRAVKLIDQTKHSGCKLPGCAVVARVRFVNAHAGDATLAERGQKGSLVFNSPCKARQVGGDNVRDLIFCNASFQVSQRIA